MNRILRIATGPSALVVVTIAAASASVVRIVLGPGAAYANIFPPPWLGLVAAAMVVPVIVLRARGSDAASVRLSPSARRIATISLAPWLVSTAINQSASSIA